MAYTLWGTLRNFFFTTAGSIADADWAKGNSEGNGGYPVWANTETSAANFVEGDPATYNLYLTDQDWLFSQQPAVMVASTTLVDPFSTTGIGNLITPLTFSDGNGGVVWWQASATSGDYDIEFENFTTNYVTMPSTAPNVTLSGSVVSLNAAVVDPTNWDLNASSSGFVLGYSTAATQSTENIYLQAFNTRGQATSPLTDVAADVSDGTQWFVTFGTQFGFYYTLVNGADTGVYASRFNTTSGALAQTVFISQATYTSYFGMSATGLSAGPYLLFTEGMSNGQHVIQATVLNSSLVSQGVASTFMLSGTTAEHWQVASVYDPNTGEDDYTALAYTDAGQVHLDLLNADGVQIGSDFIVPGLTSFDRLQSLNGGGSGRVEISYTVPDPNGGQDVLGYIYDTATSPYDFTLGKSGEYVGSPFNDTYTDGPGIHSVNGGGGDDTFVVNFSTSQVSISIDANGNAHITTPDSTDLLERFTTIDLLNATVTLETNVTGQPFSAYDTITSGGQLVGVDYFFTNVSGEPYYAYEYDYNGDNDVVGLKFYYSASGQAYTGYEYDYDGGNNLTRVAFTGVSGVAYSAYEYDYVGGIYAGAKFDFTTVPNGVSYSSYEIDYNSFDQFNGVKLYSTNVSGAPYTGEEVDFDANDQLARVLLTGFTGQGYSSLELDYDAGSYAGYKAFYAISGESYTGLEVDVSTTDQVTKAVYSGLTGAYSSVEDDYSNDSLTSTTYDFTNQSGLGGFSAYQVVQDGNGNPLQEIVDNNNGSHTIVGFQNNETFTSIGNDTFTGGGSGETFVFNPAYGSDTITDFYQYVTGANHDTISVSTSEFANITALLNDAQNVGGNTVIMAQGGDKITLDNVNVSTLTANQSDFTFHT